MTNPVIPFEIGDTDFLLEGKTHRILSGAIHYFRVHPDQWADRIHKARLMGLNAIETYVAWNAHEPRRGEWDAAGPNDLGRFLDLVAAEGMHAIVRPGPYICAEWHNGGLPVWLTAMPGIGLRRSEPQYLREAEIYLRRVYEILAPRQLGRGGSVILVQIENEYGAYGDDAAYLAELVRITRDAGIDVPLTTVDQPIDWMLAAGSIPGLHMTGSFGSRATERLATLRAHQPTGPLMCAEFWDGWFDWWGGPHHVTTPAEAAAELETMLAAGASVNFYMFHGGTNYGLTNGANDKGRYLPITTSYDYDAPLDEAGEPTQKYAAFREVIARHAPVPSEPAPERRPSPSFEVGLESLGDWVRAREGAADSVQPPAFEDVEHLGALALYETDLPADAEDGVLEVEVRDIAWVRVDDRPVGTIARTRAERAITLPRGRRLSLLVEEQGRVNYDVRLGERKGVIGPVRVDGVELRGWRTTPIDLEAVAAEMSDRPARGVGRGRSAFRSRFTLDAPVDLFLDTEPWSKGFVFVNGALLGRYWRNGPQRTLYVPAPLTRVGENELLVLELEQVVAGLARFVPGPLLGSTEE